MSDYEGKRVVIYFWVSWCPSCQTGLGYMNDFHNSYSGDEIEIISINLTNQERTPTEVMEFVKDEGLVFPVLLDETGQVAKDYQLYGTPTIYIINERGIIEERIVGLLHKEPLERLLLGKN
ncbi:MAG: TlpA family protein disulfide reductase [Bacillus sp. (in: Bacteria)]|nr:TlpA family protein disulfide reductase [Bacillus sp. (in: firmicutes)]